MTIPIIGMLVSASLATFLWVLYRIERSREARFFPRIRAYFDYGVLHVRRLWHRSTQYLGSDWIRQTGHYIFHTILNALLPVLLRLEKSVRRLLTFNRKSARRSQLARTARNHFDEIAEHKALTALTDAEKEKHKEESLKG